MTNICLAILLSFSMGSCEKECLDSYESINFERVEIGCCFYNDSSYIINDESTYQSELSTLNTNLPEIDFSQYSLIGKLMEGQCDEGCYKIKEVCKNKNSKVIMLDIKHKTGNPLKCGCKKEFSTMNWLKIPKIDNTYNVKIQIR